MGLYIGKVVRDVLLFRFVQGGPGLSEMSGEEIRFMLPFYIFFDFSQLQLLCMLHGEGGWKRV